jgi:hypothetical protein
MSIDLFRTKGTPLERQRFTWRELPLGARVADWIASPVDARMVWVLSWPSSSDGVSGVVDHLCLQRQFRAVC